MATRFEMLLNPRRTLFATGLLSLSAAFSTAQAQDWRFDPALAVGGEYDDNARLTIRTDDVVKLEGLLLEASANILYLSPTTDFQVSPLVRDRRYSDEPEFDATEVDVPLRYSFVGQKSTWKFDARYAHAPVRNAERADEDLDLDNPDDIPDDDSGLVQVRGNRDRLMLRPAWIYKLSNVSSTTLQIDYRDVSYDESFVSLRDYTDVAFTANYRRGISARSSFYVAGLFRNYEDTPLVGNDPRNEYDTIGLNAGIETQLSENLRLRVQAGAENVESPVTGIDETVPIGEVTFIRRLETIRLLAQYRRSVSSTGSGRMSEREAINVNFTRQLGERFDAGLGVRAYTNTPINLSVIGGNEFDRDYLQLNARFTWNINRLFALQTTYRYTVVSREVQGESANSNQVIVWLVWRPSGLREER